MAYMDGEEVFGGEGGNAWDDGVYDGVREITLTYGFSIHSIQIVYDKNGQPVSGPKHGGDHGGRIAQIKLKFPEEFLTTVLGCYSRLEINTPIIRSLEFRSNMRKIGPFGDCTGIRFALGVRGEKILGFKGRSGLYLDAIGLSMKKGYEKGENAPPVVGLRGGNVSNNWDDGSYDGVRRITLMFGSCIDSIQVVYDRNGTPVPGPKHGGGGGVTLVTINLTFPREFLTTVSGYYSRFNLNKQVIRSLTFKTNMRTFGPFGEEEGISFSFSTEGGKFVGFKGKSGAYLNAIGFHVLRPNTKEKGSTKGSSSKD